MVFVEGGSVEAEFFEELNSASAAGVGEHGEDFGADALAADLAEVAGEGLDGGGGAGFELKVESCGEADSAEHAEVVLGEAVIGVADGADSLCFEVVEPADVVDDAVVLCL